MVEEEVQMIRKRETGYTGVNIKDSEKGYVAKLEDYGRIKQEFMSGRPFIEFIGVYGHEITLKAGTIESIVLCSSEALAVQREDVKEEDKEDALE